MRLLRFYVLIYLLILPNLTSAQHQTDSSLVNQLSRLIIENLDTIKTEYYKINAFKDYPFQTASLFVLSNVMLNEWQLPAISSLLYNKTDSPKRYNQELDFYSSKLGEYKHVIKKLGKYYYGLYGKETGNTNFITINKEELQSIFAIDAANVDKTKELLLDKLIRYSEDDNFFLDENLVAGFNELGLMQREIMSIPKLNVNDREALYGLSAIIENDLLNLLENHLPGLKEDYSKSDQTSKKPFNDHFKKWYMSILSQTTENLIELGYIKVPTPRNFNFIYLPD